MKSIFHSTPRSRRAKPQPQHEAQAESPSAFFQPKLTINAPNDQYEREADTVADQVVNEQNSNSNAAGLNGQATIQRKPISQIQRLATPAEEKMPSTNDGRMAEDKMIQEKPEIQRMDAPKEEEKPVQKMDAPKEEEKPVQKMDAPKEEEKPIQKADEKEELQAKEEKEELIQAKSQGGTSQASPNFSSRLSASKGQGSALPKNTQAQMEQGIGADFSQVRIHTDSEAANMNKEISAQAFTHGQDVYFNQGKFSPDSTEGKRLLAHELTHVVQQGKEVKRQVQQSTDEERTRYLRQLQGSESTPHQSRAAQALQQLETNAADPNFQMNVENRAAISLLRSMYDSGQIEFWETSNSGTAAAAFHRVPNHHIRLHVVEHGATATSGFTLLHEATHAIQAQQFPGIDRLYLDDADGRLSTNRRRDFLCWRAWTEYWSRRRVIEYQRDAQGPYSQSELHMEVMRIPEVSTLVREARALDPDFNPYTWSPPSRYRQRRT